MEWSMLPQLSIIIVSYNSKDLLEQCLLSIYEHTKNLNLEVIIVDNNSIDGTSEEIAYKFPQVKLISNILNKGFAAASNQGLRMMSGEYGLLLNPDTIVLDNAFAKMVEFMESHKRIGIVGCKILNYDGSLQRAAFPPPTLINGITSTLNLGRLLPGGLRHYYRFHLERIFPPKITNCYYDDLYKTATKPFRVGWVSGACLLIRKETIRDMGYLDENLFLFGEEPDWCCRARQKRWGVFLLPEAKIVHYGAMSTSDFVSVSIRSSYQSRLYFARKHFGRIGVLMLRLISLWQLLIKSIIIGMKFNITKQERGARLHGYKESFKYIFKRVK
jgi:GT2 family glycosyltransferase